MLKLYRWAKERKGRRSVYSAHERNLKDGFGMKKIMLMMATLAFVSSPVYAQWSYGVLGIGFSMPYEGESNQSIVVPAAMYEGERVVWRGPSLQYKLTGLQRNEPSLRISLDLAPNELEVEGNALLGIEDRDFSLLAGFRYLYPTQYGQLSAVLQSDVTNTHSGQRGALNFQRVIFEGDKRKWAVRAGLQLEYLTDNYADYYFGVSANEGAASNFTQYQVDDVWQGGFTVGGYYQFNKHWRAIVQTRYMRLADEVTDSPIIDKDYIINGIVGITYQF